MVMIPVALAVVILSKDIVASIYGEGFPLASTYLSIEVLGFLFFGLGAATLGHLFSGIGKTGIIFRSSLLNFLIYIPLAALLAMFFHIPGIQVASLISGFASLIYILSVAYRQLKISLDIKSSVKIYFTSFLSIIPLLIFLNTIKINPILNVVVGISIFAFVYLTILPLTRTIDQIDVENFTIMFKNIKIVWPIIKLVLAYESKICSLL
jgi:O-antigen/teichoic acid export membrane protein